MTETIKIQGVFVTLEFSASRIRWISRCGKDSRLNNISFEFENDVHDRLRYNSSEEEFVKAREVLKNALIVQLRKNLKLEKITETFHSLDKY